VRLPVWNGERPPSLSLTRSSPLFS